MLATLRGHRLTAAVALVLAGLGAKGGTVLDGLDHLALGYDRVADKLVACGATIARTAA